MFVKTPSIFHSRHQLPQSGVLRILVSRSTVGTLVRNCHRNSMVLFQLLVTLVPTNLCLALTGDTPKIFTRGQIVLEVCQNLKGPLGECDQGVQG